MKTVILCGGFGTRLSEETVVKPKPCVEIGEHPILWHLMNWYSKFSCEDFVLALGYKSSYIKNFFEEYATLNSDFSVNLGTGNINYLNRKEINWNVDLIDTGSNTLTGGRLLRLKDHLKDEETFMLTYGDGLSNINIEELISYHRSHGKIATVTAVRPPARFGEMIMDDGALVTSFQEKPQTSQGWINGGFFVFNKEIFDYLDKGDETILERSPMEGLARDSQLMAYKHEGFWQCMDNVRDRDLLRDLWKKGDAPWA